jgi:hypothetical protein
VGSYFHLLYSDEERGNMNEGGMADRRNTGLLSFGEAEEGSEAGPSKEKEKETEKRKGLTRMDCE